MRARGRPRILMIDDLTEGSYVSMKRRAEDREEWRSWLQGPAGRQRTNDDDDDKITNIIIFKN